MCWCESLGEPFYIQKLSGKPFIRLNKINTKLNGYLYKARRKTPMKIEKWPGTRTFSPNFKIEGTGVAKHNKARTFYLRFRYALTPKESSFIFFISLIHRNGCKNTK